MFVDPRPPHEAALDIALTAIRANRADRLVARTIGSGADELLASARAIHVVAVGKAADEMYRAVGTAAGDRLASGMVVSAWDEEPDGRRPVAVRRMTGDHPIPGQRSLAAGLALREMLTSADFADDELVVFAVSGGGSALIALPRPPLSLDDLAEVHRLLVLSGLDVTEINRVRAAASQLHGGSLLGMIGPARALGLILCDTVQVGAAAVASGLTFPDFVDLAAARRILSRAALPTGLALRLREAVEARRPPAPSTTRNIVVGGPGDALAAATTRASELGYRCVSLGDRVQGEAREVALALGKLLGNQPTEAVCIVGSGEVSVTVRGDGLGGRCQELAFAMSRELRGRRASGFAAVASDGRDYLPGVMGGWVTDETFDRIGLPEQQWRRVLDRNDTHRPLVALGQCVPAERTGTNVCDVYVLCLGQGS